MDDILYEVLRAALICSVMIFVRYIVPYIKSRLTSSDLSWIYEWAVKAVEAAEQTITASGMGATKKTQVKEFLITLSKDKNLKLTDAQIENLIESAVYAMKKGNIDD